MTDRTPRTTLHPNAPTPEARQALDDAWDAWDEAAHLAEQRDYASEVHNEAEADAWARYVALKADIDAGLWPRRMVAVGDASGVTAHVFEQRRTSAGLRIRGREPYMHGNPRNGYGL